MVLSRHYLKNYNRSFKRYFFKKYSLKGRFYIVTGQRGVGKTTALIQHMLEFCGGDIISPEVLYIPVDHTLVTGYTLYENGETFYREGVKIIFFDEIHKYTNWAQDLKSLYDVYPGIKILSSGSAALEILESTHDLSRGAIVYGMKGMSFREFIELELNIVLESYSLERVVSEHARLSHQLIGTL